MNDELMEAPPLNAGLALLTMRAAKGAAKVNRCRETAR
jgi:hypothetical protein